MGVLDERKLLDYEIQKIIESMIAEKANSDFCDLVRETEKLIENKTNERFDLLCKRLFIALNDFKTDMRKI